MSEKYMYTAIVGQGELANLDEGVKRALGVKDGDKVTLDQSGSITRIMPYLGD